jgi:hypothetical protein
MGIFEFIRTNFWHVAPILLAGTVAVAIIAERLQTLFMKYPIKDAEGFFNKVRELVLQGKTAEAIGLCDRLPGKPAAQVVKQALLRAHQPESLIEHGIALEMGKATMAIRSRSWRGRSYASGC